MATSQAILWVGPAAGYSGGGGYSFGPVPQVGQRSEWDRAGENKLAAADKRVFVTLRGHIHGANLNAVQAGVAALRTALSNEEQVLYFYDGVAVRINNVPYTVVNIDIPAEWGQYHQEFTVTLAYIPLDDVHKASAVVSYGTFVFCDTTTNVTKPMPVLGRELKVERQSPDAQRESARVTLTLAGFFEGGSMTANLASLAALDTALQTDGLTLTYGTFSQTVKVLGWSHHEDTFQRRIGFVIQFMYVEETGSYNIIKMSSNRRITRVTQRYATSLVPFIDFATVQLLGRGAQKIHATGYVICDTLADAIMAAQVEIAAQFPSVATPAELVYAYGANYTGVEDPSSTVTEYAEQCRVDWSIERYFGTPALLSAWYGTGL